MVPITAKPLKFPAPGAEAVRGAAKAADVSSMGNSVIYQHSIRLEILLERPDAMAGGPFGVSLSGLADPTGAREE
jgi:hypothetical protein